MQLGAFSISLTVKDLEQSIAFYQQLGFDHYHGEAEHGFAILKNGDHIIGLFQGMFEKNILTFNPGWDQSANALDSFDDVREIQKKLKAAGVKLIQETDPDCSGPASITLEDPDVNPILIDQHV